MSNKTVAWSDGVWNMVDAMPMIGEGITWEKAELTSFHGHPYLQIWIWSAGKGETQSQSLSWFVYSFSHQKMERVLEREVGKRHPIQGKKEFLVDPKPKHGLKVEGKSKGNKVKWFLRDENGFL